MDIIIRQSEETDAKKMLDFTKIVGGETNYLSFGSEGIAMSVEQEEEFIRNIGNSKTQSMLIALYGDRIVGSCHIATKSGRSQHICTFGISVLKEYWGRKIGSRLFEQQLNFVKSISCEIIQLRVISENTRAIGLYEKLGFKKVGMLTKDIKVGNRYYDMDIMEYILWYCITFV